MAVVDAVDRVIGLPFREFRDLPPNRMRIRVGVGNRLVFNHAAYLEYGASAVIDRLANGTLRMTSRVMDIGCGCGRMAHALRRHGFRGTYDGVDVDREMVAWCAENFPGDGFRFHFADIYSKVYNPGGSKESYRLPVADHVQDLVVGQSLLTHLLEEDVVNYLTEGHRVLDAGGYLDMSVFCLEDMDDHGDLGGRWTFRHQLGDARVESLEYPEAAVAYGREWLVAAGKAVGFDEVSVIPGPFGQSRLLCRA
jgi:SAM-dependent methyltransferase